MPQQEEAFRFSGDLQAIASASIIAQTGWTTSLPQSNMLRVLRTSNNECLVVPIGAMPKPWDLRRGYTSIYEMLSGKKELQVKSQLPSIEKGVEILLSFRVQWAIADPVQVVMEDNHNVSTVILFLTGDRLRREARKWRDDQTEGAEDGFREVLEQTLKNPAFTFQFYDLNVEQEVGRRELLKRHQEEQFNADLVLGKGMSQLYRRLIAKNPDKVLEINQLLRNDRLNTAQDRNKLADLLRDGGFSETEIVDAFAEDSGIVPKLSLGGGARPLPPPTTIKQEKDDVGEEDED